MGYDVLIVGGKIVDGSGNPWYKADIGVKDGKIVDIGKIGPSDAGRVIDASGMVVSPGFIDAHSHSDFELWVNPKVDIKLRQGVTTEIIGNCGFSAAPLMGEAVEEALRRVRRLPGGESKEQIPWSSFSEYFSELEERGIPVNVASLIGHSVVRECVLGFKDGRPDEDEIREMELLVAEGMEDGALGLSSGLIYPPGCYADKWELMRLCRVVAKYGGIYTSHIRNESDRLIEAVNEAIDVGLDAGLPVHISHHKASGRPNWGKIDETLKIFEEARAKGLDVTCDVYPYTAGCSWSLSPSLPKWISEGGLEKVIERLNDPGIRRRLREEIPRSIDVSPLIKYGEWDSIVIASVKSEENRRFQGMSINDISRIRSVDPLDCIFDLIVEEEDELTVIFFSMSSDDVAAVIKHPFSMIGSDSVPRSRRGYVHPRNYGTFPRVIRKYVNESKILRLEEAIRKMTSFPAQRFNLRGRGLLKEGMCADIVIFDPAGISDMADYEDPFRYPVGVEYVIVNGVVSVDGGRYVGELAGHVIKGSVNPV